MTINEEKLGRLEEKVDGIKEDVSEIKDSIKTQTDVISKLHVSFVPRIESEKVEGEQNRKIEQLESRVRHLEQWRNWLTGALVVLTTLSMMMFEYGRQWIVWGLSGH